MTNKFETWQFWLAAKKLLGETTLLNILGRRNGRTIRMYSADPKYTGARCRDPLQHLYSIMAELDLVGRGDISRKALMYLASAVDNVPPPVSAEDLQPTINAEVIADYQAVTDLQQAIADKVPPEQLSSIVRAAKEEIDRTFSKYYLDWVDNA